MSAIQDEVEKAPVSDLEMGVASSVSEKDGAAVEVVSDEVVIDREVEKRILRKFDLHILPLLVFMYLCA